MIFLFYNNFIKFTIELSKNIHGIRINLVRVFMIIICLILIICKVKSHIAMPIIVDIYYYRGDVIWSFITDSIESCTAFLTFYDYIWTILQFETFIIGCLILFMSDFMAKIQVNR